MPNISRVPGIDLAYEYQPGSGPVVVFCSGYASDMGGTKALALLELCQRNGQAMLRFDYSGHGQSGGAFIDGTIGAWAADAAHVIREIIPEQQMLLVGSSMGGWISLLLGRVLPQHLRGLVLIAPAPDFTETLIRPSLSPAIVVELQEKGVIYQQSESGEPLPLTLKFLDDGAQHLLLGAPIPITCPVHILHGMRDDSVPWEHSLTLMQQLQGEAVRTTFVKDGDHRLSRPQDLALLCKTVTGLLGEDGA